MRGKSTPGGSAGQNIGCRTSSGVCWTPLARYFSLRSPPRGDPQPRQRRVLLESACHAGPGARAREPGAAAARCHLQRGTRHASPRDAAPRMAHTRPRGVACQCLSEPGVPRHVGRMLCVAWRAPRRAGHLVRVAWHASRRVARACQATSSAQPLVAGRAPPEWSGSYLTPDSQGYRANVHWFIF